MGTIERSDDVETPEDLAEALRDKPQAEAIWDRFPEAHRRGHTSSRSGGSRMTTREPN